MSQAESLFGIAQSLVDEWPGFFCRLGPEAGDRHTNEFMRELRTRAAVGFGGDFAEHSISDAAGVRVDYYFQDEAAIVEVAMSLRNPLSEYERDVFKALLAREAGFKVEKLYFFSKPGAVARCRQRGRSAIKKWAHETHNLEIYVLEFSPTAESILDAAEDGA